MRKLLSFLFFLGLSLYYYFSPLVVSQSPDIFLSISTFLFAIFAGFFIARQGARYNEIGTLIATFDGKLTDIYRSFGHFGNVAQKKIKPIIKKYYKNIIDHHSWDYNFTHKTTTITATHALVNKTVGAKVLKSRQMVALQRIMGNLSDLQVIRKNMVNLHGERIPVFQWMIIYLLALILFTTLSSIPSQYFVLGAILKAASVGSIVFILILLHNLNSLVFFEGIIGEGSAQDVMDIMDGKM